MTKSSSQPSAGCSRLIVGGITPSRIARSAAATSSAAPPAYRRPHIDFGAVTGTFDALSPSASFSALASSRSHRDAGGVGEHGVDLLRGGAGVLEGDADRAGELPAVWRRIAVVVASLVAQ